jgi:uncharacterized DUF497 family protein
MEFDWDYANRAHLAVHDVTPAEFEQLFAHPRYERFIVRKDEPRTWCLGQTDAGRPINAVYTERRGRIRAVTAFTMNRRERKFYEEFQKQQTRKG